MDLSPLPPPLREKVEAHLARSPKSRPFVIELLKQRASTTDDDARARHDEKMLELVSVRVGRSWKAIFFISSPFLLTGGAALIDHVRHDAALRDGVATVARVERVAEGTCLVGTTGSRCLELLLRVWPASGAPYAASLTHSIDAVWFSRVQPGSMITVVVDKSDPQRIAFDDSAMQVAAPTLPPGAQP